MPSLRSLLGNQVVMTEVIAKLPDIVRKLDHVAARAQTTNMEVEVEVEMKDDLSRHRAYFLFFLSLNEETSHEQQQATKHNKNKT